MIKKLDDMAFSYCRPFKKAAQYITGKDCFSLAIGVMYVAHAALIGRFFFERQVEGDLFWWFVSALVNAVMHYAIRRDALEAKKFYEKAQDGQLDFNMVITFKAQRVSRVLWFSYLLLRMVGMGNIETWEWNLLEVIRANCFVFGCVWIWMWKPPGKTLKDHVKALKPKFNLSPVLAPSPA